MYKRLHIKKNNKLFNLKSCPMLSKDQKKRFFEDCLPDIKEKLQTKKISSATKLSSFFVLDNRQRVEHQRAYSESEF